MQLITTGPLDASKVYILAHGAGGAMDHEWMNTVADKLALLGIKVIRFEFPYMQDRRKTGKKRPPNSKKILIETWEKVIQEVATRHSEIYIGGKSMGGRISTLLSDYTPVKGIICLGFPFHAPGKEPGDRITHLANFNVPTLILQGERDSMGKKEEIQGYSLSPEIQIQTLPDGDHGLKPRVKSGFTLDQNLDLACSHILKFMDVKHS